MFCLPSYVITLFLPFFCNLFPCITFFLPLSPRLFPLIFVSYLLLCFLSLLLFYFLSLLLDSFDSFFSLRFSLLSFYSSLILPFLTVFSFPLVYFHFLFPCFLCFYLFPTYISLFLSLLICSSCLFHLFVS